MEGDIYQADFLEEFIDHLTVEFEVWAMFYLPSFDNKNVDLKIKIVEEFIAWAKRANELQLHVPRAPDNKSFFERRQLARSGGSSLSDTQAASNPG